MITQYTELAAGCGQRSVRERGVEPEHFHRAKKLASQPFSWFQPLLHCLIALPALSSTFLTLDIAMVDPSVQQSRPEVLRRIEVVEDRFEKRIRSLEARMEERSNSLEGRLNLLGRKLLSVDTRVDNSLDRGVQRSNERIDMSDEVVNGFEPWTFKKKNCNETDKRIVYIEDKWQNLAQRCYRKFQKLEADLAELKTSCT